MSKLLTKAGRKKLARAIVLARLGHSPKSN